MQYTLNNLSIHVEEAGSGQTPLVFLHYWGGSCRTWSRVISRLDQSFRCIAYDSRGWGRSEGPIEGYSIKDLADEALALVQELALKDFVLVGHSMGGKVAQSLAARRPAGLRGLVLVAPATPSPTIFPEAALQQQLHAYDNRETVLQTIQFLSAKQHTPEIVEQIVEDSLSGTPSATKAWPTIGIREDISSVVSQIEVPTLVIAGALDKLDSVEQHKREVLPRIPDANLQVIQNSGHLLPLDEPEALATAIQTFVQTIP